MTMTDDSQQSDSAVLISAAAIVTNPPLLLWVVSLNAGTPTLRPNHLALSHSASEGGIKAAIGADHASLPLITTCKWVLILQKNRFSQITNHRRSRSDRC